MSRPFIFSAALPPAQSAAALEAFNVIDDEPERVAQLHENTAYWAAGLKEQGWDTMLSDSCVVPTLVGEEDKTMDLTRMLFDRGIFVCPIVHPAVPRGMDRLRTTVMATHTREDLDKALDAFAESGKTLGII
jgi:7-keto-8-aminopelargonate synthetase-like enzyme